MTSAELNDHALYAEIHDLVTAVLQSPSQETARRLATFLEAGGDEALRCYTSYMHETHALRRAGSDVSQLLPAFEHSSEHPQQIVENKHVRHTNFRFPTKLFALAAVAACVVVGTMLWDGSFALKSFDTLNTDTKSIATLVRTSRVKWQDGAPVLSDLSRLMPGERICIEEGKLEILFDTGVELIIAGRTDAVIDTGMRVVGKLGKFSARVSDRGRGFTIETPATDVIDLGTEFGVEIDSSGGTKVAVFEGEVDLQYGSGGHHSSEESIRPEPERLRVGEAVQIDAGGERRRLVAVTSKDFPTHKFDHDLQSLRPVLFSAVRDNIRSAGTNKFYRVIHAGFFDDVRAYVDRNHEWNGLDRRGLPVMLRGGDYVMPFNDNKFKKDFKLTLDISAPCTLYVFFDNNMSAPDWLTANFEDLGIDIGLDQGAGRYSGDSSVASGGGMSIDDTFSVWAQSIDQPSEVTLGGVDKPRDIEAGWNMYGIAATPTFARTAE